MLVRIKPRSKKKGHVLCRYTYQGIRFIEGRGWYRVSKAVAEYLATVHQIPGDEDTPLAFDVVTEEEAKRIDKTEAAKAKTATPAEAPIDTLEAADLKTADLPAPSKPPTPAKRSGKSKGGK